MIWYYVAYIAIFTILSLAHELGHMIALLAFRIPVHKLNIGFGPTWYGKNFKQSSIRRIRLKIVPFGLGAGFDGDHPNFQSLNFWKKIAVFSSGVVANLVIASVVFLFSDMSIYSLKLVYNSHDDPVNITRAFVVLNLLLALFQLLPFSKFDGGRILDSVLKRFFSNTKPDSVTNLKILITFLVGFLIFQIYRAWI